MDNNFDDQSKQNQVIQRSGWGEKIISSGEFKGNVENAEALLNGLEKGLDYSWQNKRPQKNIPINIIHDDSRSSSFISYNISPYGQEILVKNSFLEMASNNNIDTRFTFTTGGGEVAFRGSFREFFELAGVEEGDHSVYEDFHAGVLKNSEVDSVAKYDAQNHEFHALELQLKYADENNFSTETIEILRNRINAAKVTRGN